MINEYIDKPLEIGTVLKETYPNAIAYYIVGEHFIYCNDYECPQIRPHKFNFNKYISIASEEEKNQFIEDLKKNHLIWNDETGKLEREYEEITLSVKVKVEPGMNINKLLEILNLRIENPFGIYNMKFEDF